MTLKNIALPAIVLANLYKHSLIELKDNEQKSVQQNVGPVFPGTTTERVLLLINNADAEFLPGEQLTFLSGVLAACKLSMDDIAIVNLDKRDIQGHKNIPDQVKAEIIILSGIELSALELPFKIPAFQAQLYKSKKYVHIPSLPAIQNDPVLKRKLWELLKVLFLS